MGESGNGEWDGWHGSGGLILGLVHDVGKFEGKGGDDGLGSGSYLVVTFFWRSVVIFMCGFGEMAIGRGCAT